MAFSSLTSDSKNSFATISAQIVDRRSLSDAALVDGSLQPVSVLRVRL